MIVVSIDIVVTALAWMPWKLTFYLMITTILCFKCSGQPPPYGDLPTYPSISPPSFLWNDVSGSDFSTMINSAYNEAIHWRRNLFSVPVGKAGCRFVQKLSRLFQSYADCSALEGIAFKAAMVMPILLLQKPHFKSRSKEDARVLERRFKCWLEVTRTVYYWSVAHYNLIFQLGFPLLLRLAKWLDALLI